jgi:hypothetical protein
MSRDLLRLAAGSAAVCLASWLVLQATAGDVGLQRSISKGAVTLFELPIAILGVTLSAFAVAFVTAARLRLAPHLLLIGVIIGDAVAGLVLAPLAVGELEPVHAPLVFAAVSVLGLQPAAALAGAWTASVRSRDIARR